MPEVADQNVFDGVMTVIKKHSSDQAACQSAGLESHLLDDLHVNSARIVDVVLDFEDAFNIQIKDSDMDRIRTVGDAVALVKELKN
jgi:acyl carrier protein